jgi:hypothetical protein
VKHADPPRDRSKARFRHALSIPGVDLLLGRWIGFAVGGAPQTVTRLQALHEERELARDVSADYAVHRLGILVRRP